MQGERRVVGGSGEMSDEGGEGVGGGRREESEMGSREGGMRERREGKKKGIRLQI